MASAEEGSEPLKYQTLTLKVSIHCEGCKKKVKKVLHSIEGVYKTTVDSQQQKVIVIGNVEAETLIKKLLKTGKHAELWPEKKPNNPGSNNSGGGGGGGKKNKNKNKNKDSGKPNEPCENQESNQNPSGDDSPPDSSANPDGDAPNNGGKDPPKVHSKDPPKVDNKEAGNSPPREKQDGGGAPGGGGGSGGAPGGGSGGGGKKKGKKGQKENNGGGGGGGGGDGGGGEVQGVSEGTGSKPGSGGGSVVSLPAFSYAVYPTSQPPAYVVSYSAVQPSASYGGAYYPMSTNQSSYFYSGPMVAAAPGSCYIFSDENANACRIM